jgi:hypothetical protein
LVFEELLYERKLSVGLKKHKGLYKKDAAGVLIGGMYPNYLEKSRSKLDTYETQVYNL